MEEVTSRSPIWIGPFSAVTLQGTMPTTARGTSFCGADSSSTVLPAEFDVLAYCTYSAMQDVTTVPVNKQARLAVWTELFPKDGNTVASCALRGAANRNVKPGRGIYISQHAASARIGIIIIVYAYHCSRRTTVHVAANAAGKWTAAGRS